MSTMSSNDSLPMLMNGRYTTHNAVPKQVAEVLGMVDSSGVHADPVHPRDVLVF